MIFTLRARSLVVGDLRLETSNRPANANAKVKIISMVSFKCVLR